MGMPFNHGLCFPTSQPLQLMCRRTRVTTPCGKGMPQVMPTEIMGFIVGNPPFIGKLKMRDALGDGYVAVLRKVWTDVPDSADFVMYWWHQSPTLSLIQHCQNRGILKASLPAVAPVASRSIALFAKAVEPIQP